MKEDFEAKEIIKTIGEQGEEVYMRLQEIVTVNDCDYALLSVVADENDTSPNSGTDEVVVMRLKKNNDEIAFEVIEDEDEFALVKDALEEEMEEMEEGKEGEEN